MSEASPQSSLPLVFNQMRDICDQMRAVAMVQKRLYSEEVQTMRGSCTPLVDMERMHQELEDERREHEKTKALLADQTDKLQFALGEIEILTIQLTREKALFEASFGRVSEKAKKESTRSHKFETECTTIKAEREKQEEVLAFKDAKISELKKRLANQKEGHQRQMDEINIQRQQEAYISRNLATASSKAGRGKAKMNDSLR